MEEKFLQAHITILFYLILLFYLKNFTVNIIDIPKKLFNYVKVYYSFLLILTFVGFFSRIIILIQIFIVNRINKIFNLVLSSNGRNIKIKKIISVNKDSNKSKLKKKRFSDIDNNYKYSKNNCNKIKYEEKSMKNININNFTKIIKNEKNNYMNKLNYDKNSIGNTDIEKKNYINNIEDVNKNEKKIETNYHVVKNKKRNNGKYVENYKIKSEHVKEMDKKEKMKNKIKNSPNIENSIVIKENINNDTCSNQQKYNFFTQFSKIIYNNYNFVEKDNNESYNGNNNINNSTNNSTINNINNSINCNSNNNIYTNTCNSFNNYGYENNSYTNTKEINDKMNDTINKSEKTPLKSILKKNSPSNVLKIKSSQEIKNDKHIRFNSDIETCFFEKYSFEDNIYDNNNDGKNKLYKILDAYNLTNTDIFNYCNVRYNLNLVINDIISSIFVYKDKLVKKF